MAAAGILMLLSGLALLVMHWEIIAEARVPGVLTLAALTIAALGLGHWLGGPEEEDRTALAVACASRHLGIAVLVAASVPGPRTAVLMGVYLITAAAVSIPYLRWRRRKPRSRVSA
jgi:hypothetical protein